jgi:hypothetical protein
VRASLLCDTRPFEPLQIAELVDPPPSGDVDEAEGEDDAPKAEGAEGDDCAAASGVVLWGAVGVVPVWVGVHGVRG